MLIWRIIIVAMIIHSLCIAGCANIAKDIVEGIPDNLFESKEDAKRKQQNPASMIEEIDKERHEETIRDITVQNDKEETAEKEKFNQMFQRQLQIQQEQTLPK